MSQFRKYITPLIATLFILVIAAGALAGQQTFQDPPADESELTQADEGQVQVDVEDEGEDDGQSGENEADGENNDNHGECVSTAAKTDELEGWQKGMFVSSVAQSDLTGSDCDFSEQLAAASEAEKPGKSGDHDAGNDENGDKLTGQEKAEQVRNHHHGPGDDD